MKKYTKEIIIGLTAGLIGGYFIRKKLTKKFLNYVNIEKNQQARFTIKNQTGTQQMIHLFDSYENYVNSNVSISPSMQQFNQFLPRQPLSLETIQVESKQEMQTNQPFTKICKDANGNESKESLIPMISPYQAQSKNTVLKVNNVLLDGKC
jgi:hypothetical protein